MKEYNKQYINRFIQDIIFKLGRNKKILIAIFITIITFFYHTTFYNILINEVDFNYFMFYNNNTLYTYKY